MGAGGGGCMLVICPDKEEEVKTTILKSGGKPYILDIFHYDMN